MLNKIKVLVVPSDMSGVGKFRSIDPHTYIEKYYNDEFHVDINYNPVLDNDEWLAKYDIIHYHRTLGPYENMENLLNKLDNMGIITIMDIDDYWSPGQHHPAYILIKKSGLDKKILRNIELARNITTTTDLFAGEIRKYNRKVWVIPNCVDAEENQYTPKNTYTGDRLRIGWAGGSSHKKDLENLNGLVNRLKNDGLMNKLQFVLCGFDLRGSVTSVDEKTGEQKTRPIKPTESVWYDYEKIFTDNYSTVSSKYKNFLLTFKNEEYPNVEDEPYRRVWTKPVTSYATHYNLFDVSLAPLEENIFNKCKSQLKIVESGIHEKAIIAQNYGPYTIDLKNAITHGGGFDNTANAILIDSNRNHKGWYQAIKKLIQNPEYVKVLGKNLNNTVRSNYTLEVVTPYRIKLYRKLLEKNTNYVT